MITTSIALLKQIFNNSNIEKAVNDVNVDWYDIYEGNKGILDLL